METIVGSLNFVGPYLMAWRYLKHAAWLVVVVVVVVVAVVRTYCRFSGDPARKRKDRPGRKRGEPGPIKKAGPGRKQTCFKEVCNI